VSNPKNLFFLIFFLFSFQGFSATYNIGPTRAYVSPNALYVANVVQDGDIIEIDAGTYPGTAALAIWSRNNLVIRGVGGRAILPVTTENIAGKGIWVLAGNDITVENIEFSGAAVPDQNGAGIRLEGSGLTVRNCYFHDNENGILTNNTFAGDVLIEYSEFDNNGAGDGQSHNLYVGNVNSLTFRYNYSHHATVGHNLKSRARDNFILYNRIMDEQTGNSSRLLDISSGGFTIVMGNLLMQGPSAPNNNILGYGLEGLSNAPPHELHVINNTFLNKRAASCLFVAIQSGTTVANVSNNIFTGTGTLIFGTTTTMTNNYVEPNFANMDFVDEANYDYRLNSTSPAVDIGAVIPPVNGNSLTPDMYYTHPYSSEPRTTLNGTIDVGAYEVIAEVLPVELVRFNAKQNGVNVDLSWATTSENNNDRFVVEYSIDGMNFSSIGEVKGQGNSTVLTNYTFVHQGATTSGTDVLYYRLRQVDFDETFGFSDTEIVTLDLNPDKYVLFPNLVTNKRDVTISGKEITSIEVYSITGQLMNVESYEGVQGVVLSTSNLTARLYGRS